jgi:hypothetical protein
MWRYVFSITGLRARSGKAAHAVCSDAMRVHHQDADGSKRFDGERFALTPQGRPFVRTMASALDRRDILKPFDPDQAGSQANLTKTDRNATLPQPTLADCSQYGRSYSNFRNF